MLFGHVGKGVVSAVQDEVDRRLKEMRHAHNTMLFCLDQINAPAKRTGAPPNSSMSSGSIIILEFCGDWVPSGWSVGLREDVLREGVQRMSRVWLVGVEGGELECLSDMPMRLLRKFDRCPRGDSGELATMLAIKATFSSESLENGSLPQKRRGVFRPGGKSPVS